MIDCCELALYNAQLAKYIALGAFTTLITCLAIVRNYYVKMKGLTIELKKKNGHEQAQINQLQEKVKSLEKNFSNQEKEKN